MDIRKPFRRVVSAAGTDPDEVVRTRYAIPLSHTWSRLEWTYLR